MQNKHHFNDLVPLVLRSVPYIVQSHACKAYVALENLYGQKPHWPESVWKYCESILRDDEPKVAGLIVEELIDLDAIADPTSGRDFGPDWILEKGLMPLSYWAMRKKYHEVGFEALFQIYLDKALDHPIYLGHEISVLAGYRRFYQDVLSAQGSSEKIELFLQRFTEFVTTTYDGRNDTVFKHPAIDEIPAESAILEEALINPGFFGHNILAFVWSQRIKPIMNAQQHEAALYNLTVMTRWHPFGQVPNVVTPCEDEWTEEVLDEHLIEFFPKGPSNIHQITLADALLWVWNHFPEYRRLCAANVLCFTNGVRPA